MNHGQALILALAAGLSPSCDAPEGGYSARLLTVAELDPRIDELDGDTVSVAGYLARCGGYDCYLYRSKQDSEAWDRVMEAVRQKRKVSIPDFPAVGIGEGKDFEFDSKAAHFVGGYVVITGIVTDQCRFEGRPACTDRGTDLKPVSISSWKGAGPPTAQRGASRS